nr:DinQ-like type I toxin DqlB [Escherichia marmotae]
MINQLIIVLRAVTALANALIAILELDPPVHRVMMMET